MTVDGDAPEKWTALRRAVVTLVNNNCVAAAPQLPPRSGPPTPTAVPTADVTAESVTVSAETAAAAAGGACIEHSAKPNGFDIAVSTTHTIRMCTACSDC
jgi:hypothetical protein